MSGKGTVNVRVARGARGRQRLEHARRAASPDPTPTVRVPHAARMLALAHHWQGLIRSGAIQNQAELARLVGVSRARVTHVMRLLDLAPDIQEEVLDRGVDGPGAEKTLRAVAEEPLWGAQRAQSCGRTATRQASPDRHDAVIARLAGHVADSPQA